MFLHVFPKKPHLTVLTMFDLGAYLQDVGLIAYSKFHLDR